MINEKIILDGKKYGVAVFLKDKQQYLLFKNENTPEGVPKLFRSVELAKVFLKRAKGIFNPRKYELYISLDGKLFHFNEVGYYNGHFIIYDSEKDIQFFVDEGKNERVLKLGYLIFYDALNSKIEKELAQTVQKEIFRAVKEQIQQSMLDNIYLSKIFKDQNGHLSCSIKFSTAKIHICYNSQIIHLNQMRKENGIRCLPFDKDVDSNSSLYCYITKDVFEPDVFESEKTAEKFLENIVEKINPELNCSFYNVDFKGDIRL